MQAIPTTPLRPASNQKKVTNLLVSSYMRIQPQNKKKFLIYLYTYLYLKYFARIKYYLNIFPSKKTTTPLLFVVQNRW